MRARVQKCAVVLWIWTADGLENDVHNYEDDGFDGDSDGDGDGDGDNGGEGDGYDGLKEVFTTR